MINERENHLHFYKTIKYHNFTISFRENVTKRVMVKKLKMKENSSVVKNPIINHLTNVTD
jgi:hypothetical protein